MQLKAQPNGALTGPVKSEFGYHLIKVEDSKPAEIVTFDEAKPRIEKQLGNEAVRKYVDDISEDIEIEIVKKPEPAKAAEPAAAAPAATEEKKD
jgi:peptidyl-prolyl cis-trans isomerase C